MKSIPVTTRTLRGTITFHVSPENGAIDEHNGIVMPSPSPYYSHCPHLMLRRIRREAAFKAI